MDQASGKDLKRKKLLEEAKKTSQSSGIYLMRDKNDVILYIGKAKNLKNRVSSYFQAAVHESPRTEILVTNITHFEVILTETEAEALILECSMIKKHKPKFNVMLKDDKAYPYIRIRTGQDFPRLEWTRKVIKDGSRYFGPFVSAYAAKQVLQLLNETLMLRDCSDNTFKHRSRPCILYQMKRCTAPCVNLISKEQYHQDIQKAIQVLEGKNKDLICSLKDQMEELSQQEEFERAAYYRDQIQNLSIVTQTQGIEQPGKDQNQDFFGIARDKTQAQGVILQVRSGVMVAVKQFHFENIEEETSDSEVLTQFIAQHHLDIQKELKKTEVAYVQASEIISEIIPEEKELLENAFELKINSPKSKEEKQLMSVALANASHSLESKKRTSKDHGIKALEEIQKKLGLDKLPQRIECFDISNIQDSDPVASRVVFINGRASKNDYRKYKIKTVEGQNDFAMMKEVLSRRFSNKEDALPDLVVIDGGKGQLSQAVAILEEIDVQGVDVVGLAKARTESDFESSEVKQSMERIFLPGRKNPVMLKPGTSSFQLLTHLRDEAHRFAVSYHRHLRSKRHFGK